MAKLPFCSCSNKASVPTLTQVLLRSAPSPSQPARRADTINYASFYLVEPNSGGIDSQRTVGCISKLNNNQQCDVWQLGLLFFLEKISHLPLPLIESWLQAPI